MAKLEYYKDGYKAKVEYYLIKYLEALDEEDLDLMDRSLRKLSFFHFKHESFVRNKRFQASLKKSSP